MRRMHELEEFKVNPTDRVRPMHHSVAKRSVCGSDEPIFSGWCVRRNIQLGRADADDTTNLDPWTRGHEVRPAAPDYDGRDA